MKNIFKKSRYIDKEDTFKYLQNQLSEKEKNSLEQNIQNSDFFSDAFEGLEMIDPQKSLTYINEINNKVKPKTKAKLSFKIIGIAASVALIIGSFFFLQSNESKLEMAKNEKPSAPLLKAKEDLAFEKTILESEEDFEFVEPTDEKAIVKEPTFDTSEIVVEETKKEANELLRLKEERYKKDEKKTDVKQKTPKKNNPPNISIENSKSLNKKKVITEKGRYYNNDDAVYDYKKDYSAKKRNDVKVTKDETEDEKVYSDKESGLADYNGANYEAKKSTKRNKKGSKISTKQKVIESAEDFKNGKSAYLQQKYESATKSLKKAHKNEPYNLDIIYYLACSYYKEDKINKAISFYQKYINNEGTKHLSASRWFLANSYLKKGKKEKAEELLNQLLEYENGFKEKAKIKLESLK